MAGICFCSAVRAFCRRQLALRWQDIWEVGSPPTSNIKQANINPSRSFFHFIPPPWKQRKPKKYLLGRQDASPQTHGLQVAPHAGSWQSTLQLPRDGLQVPLFHAVQREELPQLDLLATAEPWSRVVAALRAASGRPLPLPPRSVDVLHNGIIVQSYRLQGSI